jgi:hypothetical protein
MMMAGSVAGATDAGPLGRRRPWRAGIGVAVFLFCAGLVCAQVAPKPVTARQPAPKAGANKAAATQTVIKRLFVSGSAGGIAEIQVPADWEMSGRSTPIDIRLTRPGSRDYMRITALPVPRERMALMTDD